MNIRETDAYYMVYGRRNIQIWLADKISRFEAKFRESEKSWKTIDRCSTLPVRHFYPKDTVFVPMYPLSTVMIVQSKRR